MIWDDARDEMTDRAGFRKLRFAINGTAISESEQSLSAVVVTVEHNLVNQGELAEFRQTAEAEHAAQGTSG